MYVRMHGRLHACCDAAPRPTLFFSYFSKVDSTTSYGQGTLTDSYERTRLGLLVGPELGLVDVDTLPGGALAAGLLRGAQTALLPHLAVPLMPQLLLASLPPAAAPCMQTSRTRGN